MDVEDQEEIVTFITNATESGGQLSEEDLETLRTKYGFPEEFLQRIIDAILAAQVTKLNFLCEKSYNCFCFIIRNTLT